MKLKILTVFIALHSCDSIAAPKYLVCQGTSYHFIKRIEDAENRRDLRVQTTPKIVARETYILENNRIYDENKKEIKDCKIDQYAIKCNEELKRSSVFPDFAFFKEVFINRIDGTIKSNYGSHQYNIIQDGIKQIELFFTYFDGACELNSDVKF